MRIDEACRLVQEITYRPEFTIFAIPSFISRKDSIDVEVIAEGLLNSNAEHAPGYRSLINRVEIYTINVSEIQSREELYARVLGCLIDFEVHEAREFFSVGSHYKKPFHPHQDEGIKNWSKFSEKESEILPIRGS